MNIYCNGSTGMTKRHSATLEAFEARPQRTVCRGARSSGKDLWPLVGWYRPLK